MNDYWPEIGHLTDHDRALGWTDIHCDNCGAIGGAAAPGGKGGRIVWCSHCPSLESELEAMLSDRLVYHPDTTDEAN
jgi:hypothetical protein